MGCQEGHNVQAVDLEHTWN